MSGGTLGTYFELNFTSSTNSVRDRLANPSLSFALPTNANLVQVFRDLEANNNLGNNEGAVLYLENIQNYIFIQTSLPVQLITESNQDGMKFDLNRLFFIVASVPRLKVVNTDTTRKVSIKAIYS